MQVTVIPLSPHHQPQAPHCECEPLVHYPIIPKRREGRRLPHITTPVRQFLMAALPLWPDRVWHMLQWRVTGRQTQRNIRGVLALKQSIIKGNPALPMTHLDDTRGTKRSTVYYSILPVNGSSSFQAFLLIDDTNSHTRFICIPHLLSYFFLFSPALPQLSLLSSLNFTAHLIPPSCVSFVTWMQRSLNPNITQLSIPEFHSAFILSSQHGIQPLFHHSNLISALIPSFQYFM